MRNWARTGDIDEFKKGLPKMATDKSSKYKVSDEKILEFMSLL